MIEASIGAVADLVPVFLVAAVLIAVPVVLLARAKKWPVVAATLWSLSLLGVLAVTLLPGGMGDAGMGVVCYIGPSLRGVLSTTQGQLNVLLFVPVCFFGVCAFRRPTAVLAGGLLLTAGVEMLQALLSIGRSCSYSDLEANALGVVAGVLCGTAWLALRRHRPLFTWRDVWTGGRFLGVGGVVIGAIFWFGIPPVYGGPEFVAATSEQDAWARSAAAEVYGEQAEVVRVRQQEAIHGFPGKVEIVTDKGNLTALWPQRKMESLFSVDYEDDEGSLSSGQSRSAAEEFAARWYPDETKGSEVTFEPVAKGKAPYVLSYRRHVDGIMMPMRLDITVTSSGRIVGVATRLVADPKLPEPELDQAAAERRAEELTGLKAGSPVFLVAQEVDREWRPVWVVNMSGEGETEPGGVVAVHLDAVSGQMVQRQD
ncbi:VanZ family protein [Streptomyces tagetis]|uniref:VanZ family protein n=1 Tax=Streptomyces tagetis TaxID=2820809 RepID=A0A941B2R1_9ACTN|nr:VanZ family protein [Streptomyces sp. RG38]MBQ0829436.1 VanZ family protein [Streptomyces sp. RG38]